MTVDLPSVRPSVRVRVVRPLTLTARDAASR